jgi:ABC-type transport system involved in multi-copper enzyme maturation permease subunit
MNPVLVREVRSRWRGRSFVLILAYLVLLIGVVGWNYSSYDMGLMSNTLSSTKRMAQAGHEMFLTISWMQTLFYLLLAPACTATSIASEREHGLLESLQLSPLQPWKIVWGKLIGRRCFW